MNRFLSGLAAAAMLGGLGLAGAPSASSAATYKACVKKKTGEMRMTSKKCKKGWKRITWTKSGPTGDKGPAGGTGKANSLGTLVDATGADVGTLLGAVNMGPTMFTVDIDGGVYFYYPNGWLLPTVGLYFTDSACTGPAFVTATSVEGRDEITQSYGLRPVYRTTAGGVLGTPEVYKPAGGYLSVFNQARWRKNDAGACEAEPAPFTGYLVTMERITGGPTDRPGPLAIR